LATGLKDSPNDPAKWQSSLNDLVSLLMLQGKFDDAAQVLDNVLTPAIAKQPDAKGLIVTRAEFFARRGRWKQAVADLEKLIEIEPASSGHYHMLAPLILATGDVESYRELCRNIVAQFSGTQNPGIADPMAKSCLILPPSNSDMPVIMAWAEAAVRQGTGSQFFAFFQFTKGLAEYRAGHYASAVDWMHKTLAETGRPWNDVVDFEAYMVLAMAEFQLKHSDEARVALARGIDIAETKLPHLDSEDLGVGWSAGWIDLLIGHTLMKEAKALIEGPSAPVSKPLAPK
jgi:tetratricopeptide (TPR) repeat protein